MPEIKKIDEKGRQHFEELEGRSRTPYLDTEGIPTIGIGMTFYPFTRRRVTMSDKALTDTEVNELFAAIVQDFETTVWSVTRDDISQKQFNALVSLCYNIGQSAFKSSTLLKRVNSRASAIDIAAAFWMWTKQVVLIKRRAKEIMLYFSKPTFWIDQRKWTKAELWEAIVQRLS